MALGVNDFAQMFCCIQFNTSLVPASRTYVYMNRIDKVSDAYPRDAGLGLAVGRSLVEVVAA